MVIPTYKCIYRIMVINVSYNVIYYVNSNENIINIYIYSINVNILSNLIPLNGP